ILLYISSSDDEEPSTIRGPVDVRSLNQSIDLFLLRRKHLEVALGRRRQRLDQVLHRILVDAADQIEQQDRHFSIRQEQWMDVPLCKILHYRMIIRKITIVDKRLVQSYKRVCTARMPDTALRRIAVVADPDVSLEIFQLVIFYNIISVADEFEN